MAPISTKVIALLTTMLEHLQQNPDDSQETETLIKATLQAISSNRRSAIRRMGDAFLDFYDEKPLVATAVVAVVLAIPQQMIIQIWREIYPSKVRIEVKEPETGSYVPADTDSLHALLHIPKKAGDFYVQGLGIGFEEAETPKVRKLTTAGGNDVILHDGTATPTGRPGRPMQGGTERMGRDANTDYGYRGFSGYPARTH